MELVIKEMNVQEKLKILSDAAKYDVACTSSGHDRKAEPGALGDAKSYGICHAFAADGRCVSLLKVLMTNECIFDCKYCVNRKSRDTVRATFSPDELCDLTIQFYKRNYIEGLFLSSGIIESPNHTMELMYETLFKLRYVHRFLGYIHVKAIPGADPVLIEKIGYLADRMSINIEFPTQLGLKTFAPNKQEKTILHAVNHIRSGIHGQMEASMSAYDRTRLRFQTGIYESRFFEENEQNFLDAEKKKALENQKKNQFALSNSQNPPSIFDTFSPVKPTNTSLASAHLEDRKWLSSGKLSSFSPAGQSTQMIIGASKESDYEITMKAENMYRTFDMKRVFYSAFLNTTSDPLLPDTSENGPELLREHRLYQADFLMRYYGFRAGEILTPDHPNLHPLLDPKCTFALANMHLFPVEVQTADYGLLLRVPGIGPKSAERIVHARRHDLLTFDALKRMGVVLKRAHYFLLCNGKQMFNTKIEENFIRNELIYMDREKNWKIQRKDNFRQMDLFRDMGISS